jgi:ATP-dependent Clp protease ATP-binding subunit ClpA
MSQIGRELHLTLQAALREAISRRHAYVTVEHLFFALLHDERGIEVLRHAGGDVRRCARRSALLPRGPRARAGRRSRRDPADPDAFS